MNTYTERKNAIRAARRHYGNYAQPGEHFHVEKNAAGRWEISAIAFEAPAVCMAADMEAAKVAPEPVAAAPKVKRAPKAKGPTKREAAEADAREGNMPTAPDFSAPTHKAHRKLRDALVAAVARFDLAELGAFEPKPYSSSQKALGRYRDLAVLAITARMDRGEALDAGDDTSHLDDDDAPAAMTAPEGMKATDMTQEEWNAFQRGRAIRYAASRFLGRGQYDNREAATMDEAREIAATMGGRVMLNAITPEGWTIYVETIENEREAVAA